jgi:hypothetical protein
MKRWIIGIAVAAAILLGTTQVRADEFVFAGSGLNANFLNLTLSGGGSASLSTGDSLLFQAHNQGWWSPTDGNSLGNDNYIVGTLTSVGPFDFNDFFTFDVSSLSGQTVTGAVLSVVPFLVTSDTGRSQQIVSFFDVVTDATTLNDISNNPNAAIFADLGSGTLYGTYAFPIEYDPVNYTNVTLNASAVADINAAIGAITTGPEFFSIGGTLTPLASVPEPCTLAIFSLLGAGGWLGMKLRRRRSQPVGRQPWSPEARQAIHEIIGMRGRR